jgi:hypothetical protein
MTGFDSESDRRDAIRKQVVDEATGAVLRAISNHAVTFTPAERTFLQTAVAERLLFLLRIEAMSMLMREEIATATQEIEET